MFARFALALCVALTALTARAADPTAEELVEDGKRHADSKRYAAAIESFTAALKLEPKHPLALLYRGDAHQSSGDIFAAMRDYNEATVVAPWDARGFIGRGQIRHLLGVNDKAEADQSVAIQLDPKNEIAFVCRGATRFALGKFEAARTDLTEAIRLNPASATAYHNRGVMWSAAGEMKKAIADFTDALRIDPTRAVTYYARGSLHVPDVDKMLEDFGNAIRFDPENAVHLVTRSSLYRLFKGDLDAALKDATAAIKANPKFLGGYLERATIRIERRDWTGASADLDEAVKLGPNSLNAHLVRAYHLAQCPDEKLRDAVQASKDAKRACDLTEWKHPFALAAFARTGAALGDYDSAVKWQKKALENALYKHLTGEEGEQLLRQYENRRAPDELIRPVILPEIAGFSLVAIPKG